MNYIVGSPHYIAPELLLGKPDLKSDIWSIGVIIFVMLTGKRPFEGKNQIEIFRLIKDCDYDQKVLKDANISEEAKDLIIKLLVIDVEKRFSTSEALKHPWFEKFKKKESLNEKTSLENSILLSLKSFTKANLLKKEILFILAKLSSDIEIFKLREVFMQFDKDNTGTIEFEEIYGAFKKIGFEPKEVYFSNS
jgi:calcium-dependent protein kinase